jgi:hypothetical protein
MYIKKYSNFFIILFFLLIFSFLLKTFVHAETIDSSASPLVHTVAIGLHNDPFLDTYSLDTLVNTGGHRRIRGEIDRVTVVPGDLVDLIYLYRSTEEILLEKIRFSVSRNTSTSGDLSKILKIDELSNDIVISKWGNVDLYKEGIGKQYVLNRNLLAGEEGRILLGTYEVIQPIQISSWELIPNVEKQEVNLKVVVKNVTQEYLNNVEYEHCGHLSVRDFLPEEEYIYSYELEKSITEGEDFELGNINISDPNTKTESSVYGSRYYQYFLSDAIPVYAYFNGGWFSGAYVQPEGSSFSVQRLPYSFVSEDITYTYVEDVDNGVDNGEGSHEKKILGIQQSILENIKELPKTYISNNRIILSLLVVDIYLWYSFLKKRRNYESKNKDTRICSKSSKDVRKGRF